MAVFVFLVILLRECMITDGLVDGCMEHTVDIGADGFERGDNGTSRLFRRTYRVGAVRGGG